MTKLTKVGLLMAAAAAAVAFGVHLTGHFGGAADAAEAHGHGAAKESDAHADAHGQAAPAALPPGVNAVQNEMRLLLGAMNVVVASVANNDLKAIPPAIHAVHEARMLTEKAIESGRYKLPKNADRLAAFIQEDDAFHEELVTLLGAVKRNDLPAATKQVGALVNGCTSCHATYRF